MYQWWVKIEEKTENYIRYQENEDSEVDKASLFRVVHILMFPAIPEVYDCASNKSREFMSET